MKLVRNLFDREKLILLVLTATQFTHIVDFMIMMPLGPQLIRIFGISPQQFSLLVASYTFSAGISGLVGAFIIDRFDRKNVLLVAYIGLTIGTLACGLSPNYHSLMAARIFAGAFGGILSALVLSIVSDIIPIERRASAMGMVMTAFSIASVLGVPIGLWIANQLNWNAPFLFLSAITSIVTLLIIKTVPSIRAHIQDKQTRPSAISNIRSIITDKNAVKALVMMSLLVFGQFSIIPFISPYMVYNVGFSEDQLPLIYLCGGASTIFTLPLIGRWADKHGHLKVFVWAVLLSAFPILSITDLGSAPLWVALLVTTLFMVMIGGRMIPATTMITTALEPKKRGSFMSINSCVQQFSSSLASVLGGFILVKTENGSLLHYNWIGYFALIATFISLFLARKLKSVSEF